MTDTSAFEPAEYLRRLFDDVEFSYLVVVAAQLGVADLLASSPRPIADLSAATGVDAQSLYRVLRALASRGLFREDGDKRYSLTPLAEPLRQDAPHSIRPQALWSGSEAYRRAWGDLAYSVRTGQPAFDHVPRQRAVRSERRQPAGASSSISPMPPRRLTSSVTTSRAKSGSSRELIVSPLTKCRLFIQSIWSGALKIR
jgi:hypothetical protein